MKNRNQQGFVLLLELMIATLVAAVMLSAATVGIVRLNAVGNQLSARDRVKQVASAKYIVTYCAIPANACSGMPFAPIVPPAGQIVTEGYTFQMTLVDGNTWTFTATPVAWGYSGAASFFVTNDQILRCTADGSTPDAGSPACQ